MSSIQTIFLQENILEIGNICKEKWAFLVFRQKKPPTRRRQEAEKNAYEKKLQCLLLYLSRTMTLRNDASSMRMIVKPLPILPFRGIRRPATS